MMEIVNLKNERERIKTSLNSEASRKGSEIDIIKNELSNKTQHYEALVKELRIHVERSEYDKRQLDQLLNQRNSMISELEKQHNENNRKVQN